MVVDLRQNLRDDRQNDCRSFCSTYHPSSQSRKISIGITVDSLTKRKTEATKEAEFAMADAEGINFNEENTEPRSKGEGITTADRGKKYDGAEQVSSPWITTRSSHPKAPTLDTAPFTKQSGPMSGRRLKKLNGVKDKQATNSVQFFANGTAILQTSDGSQKKYNGRTYRRKKGNGNNPEGLEEFTFVTAREVSLSDKAVLPDKMDNAENGKSEKLRMKLWEILGTVSSPKSQNSNLKASEVGADKLKQKQVVHQTGDTVSKPKHNSDSIETDSESPNQPTRRPLTRSLTRNKATTKVQQKKTKNGSSSTYRQKHGKKNIFPFEEGWSGKLDAAINLGSSKPTGKKSQRRSSAIEPRKICFSEKDIADEPHQASYSRESPPPRTEKSSSLGNKVEFPPEDGRNHFEAKNNIQEKDCQPPVQETMKQTGEFASPALEENGNHLEDCNHSTLKNVFVLLDEFQSPSLAFKTPTLSPFHCSMPRTVQLDQDCTPVPDERRFTAENRNQQDDFNNLSLKNVVDPLDESPTLAFKTPALSPSPCSTPRTVQMEQDCTPVPVERRFTVGNIRSFRSLQTSKPDCSGSDAATVLPDDAEKLKDSSPIELSPVKDKKEADGLVESPYEIGDPRSSEEDSPIIKGFDCRRQTSPKTGNSKDQNRVQYPTKRLRNNVGIRVVDFSPPLTSPQGTMEQDWFQKPTEQNQEDEWLQEPREPNQEDDLARAVTLFTFALDNFKKKMDSATRKKSSEILTSVSEEIHSQLKTVETQIQTDVGKLTSLSKSKRKRLETRFEEQQEGLKLIHEKFKKDIHHHLQDCRSTLEVLEAHQFELKGTVKKQKTSHQKLLLQQEEAIETQLSDAQRRIITVHELAREKMLQLKHVIAECLEGGILS